MNSFKVVNYNIENYQSVDGYRGIFHTLDLVLTKLKNDFNKLNQL